MSVAITYPVAAQKLPSETIMHATCLRPSDVTYRGRGARHKPYRGLLFITWHPMYYSLSGRQQRCISMCDARRSEHTNAKCIAAIRRDDPACWRVPRLLCITPLKVLDSTTSCELHMRPALHRSSWIPCFQKSCFRARSATVERVLRTLGKSLEARKVHTL